MGAIPTKTLRRAVLPAFHLARDEVGDDLFVESLDEIRVQALFLGPLPAEGEHCLLAFRGADAVRVLLEPDRGCDVAGTTAEQTQYFTVQGVYGLAYFLDALALFGLFYETSPRTRTSEPAATMGASRSVLRER
jgi:hypothetical protein